MTTMRPEVMWLIRDSRELTAPEKALLWAVESRGVAHGTWETVANDAGVGRTAFYRLRKELAQRGALEVRERPGTTTTYRVLPAGLSPSFPNPAGGSAASGQGGLSRGGTEVEPGSTTSQVEPSVLTPPSPFSANRTYYNGEDRADDEPTTPTASESAWSEARRQQVQAELIESGEVTVLPARSDLTRQERKAYDGHARMLRDENYTGDDDPSLDRESRSDHRDGWRSRGRAG